MGDPPQRVVEILVGEQHPVERGDAGGEAIRLARLRRIRHFLG
jgi:hypothetical protein